MAAIMTKRGSQDNVVTYEHICDTRADMALIDDRYVTLGSTCIILKGTSGGMEVYIADSNHQWQSLAIAGGSSGSGGTVIVNSSPLFHVCTSSEVRINGTPKISNPEENTIYLVPTNGETNNLFNEYLYVNSKWEMIGSAGIDLSEYATYQDLARANFATHNDLNNYATHDDLNDYASLDDNGKVLTEQLPFPAISSDDNDKILKVKNGDWSVENEVDISGKVDKTYEINFEPKTWNGLTSFSANNVWIDGENIYYSAGTEQYVLDKSTSTWVTKAWNGLTSFSGNGIWTDKEDIYYSSLMNQYILDRSTSTWITKTWKGMINFNAIDIWTDGENIYHSSRSGPNSIHYVLDKSTSTWNTKTWNGLTVFAGRYIWTDRENIYYSYQNEQYVLDKATSTWNAKTWNGLTRFDGDRIWTDGEEFYCDESYFLDWWVLDKSTSTWNNKTWSGMPKMLASYIWTDGENIYYSYNSNQYILGKNKILLGNNGTFSPVTLEQFTGTLMQKFPRIPKAPATDGTYTLQVNVTNGTPAYSWV